jgi:hypothetical protein
VILGPDVHDPRGRVVRRHARLRRGRSRADLAQLEELEAEGLDLGEAAEHCGLILKRAGEHGLTAVLFRHHRGEADRAVSPSRPLIRIVYKLGGAGTW